MNGKRAYWKWLVASAGVGLLVSNCTIKSTSDGGTGGGSSLCTAGTKITGCTCTGNVIGSQLCLPDGTFAACACATDPGQGGTGGTASPSGGATSVAGTGGTATTAGAGGYSGGAGATGTAGNGGASCGAGTTADDCYGCLSTLCAAQWTACVADNEKTATTDGQYCLSTMQDDSGQIEKILDCIAAERAKGLARRDAVRACGATIGDSSDPQFFLWAPPDMTKATTDLMNCMADAPDTPAAMAGAWATDPTNFPEDGGAPAPWVACTCAKLSCTSSEANTQ